MSSFARTIEAGLSGGLRRLLSPRDPEEFIRTYFGEQVLHVGGDTDRFADLFSWRDLNALLSRDAPLHQRVRLVKDSQDVPPACYTRTVVGRHYVDGVECQQQMSLGATLIVQMVDRTSEQLQQLVDALQRELEASVHIDAVATTAPVPGLHMHWDQFECINVQIAGSKRWRVVKPHRLYPMRASHHFPKRRDVMEANKPSGEPTWEGELTQGDVLYVPRGWWHAVTPARHI
jgi:ribosomal protein L16 Arg81 hydroxylase